MLKQRVGKEKGGLKKAIADDLKSTLENLTVDISKVTYVPKAAINAAAALPAINNKLVEGNASFDMTIEVAGQKIPMQMTRTISKDGDLWMVKDESKSPMGDMIDVMKYRSDWINTATKTADKIVQVIPAMQNAVMTMVRK